MEKKGGNKMEKLFLTEKEIKEIEELRDYTIGKYIEDLPNDKKQLVMKQYEKESTIRQLKTIVNERYQ